MFRRSGFGAELYLGVAALFSHRLRTLLALIGLTLGIAAVVATLAINAGAQREMAGYVNLLGVDNIIVEAKEPADRAELQSRRALPSGLTLRDFREIELNVPGLKAITPRKQYRPVSLFPKPKQAMPLLVGVGSNFTSISNLQLSEGRFFRKADDETSAPVCVLSYATKLDLFGSQSAEGQYLKIGDTWLEVIGVLAPRPPADAGIQDLDSDRNNTILAPINTVLRRFSEENNYLRDEIDGIYMRVGSPADSIKTARLVTALLSAAHQNVSDFQVLAPAGFLNQRRRALISFDIALTAIAIVALLTGGIGMAAVLLGAVLERTAEIGIRRSVGARSANIFRQFLTDAVAMALGAGVLGIILGFVFARFTATATGWPSAIALRAILAGLGISIGVGVVCGVYPANRAANINLSEVVRG